jgi:hypothetical protein
VIWNSQRNRSSHAFFDVLVRNLGNGGSRRDFVRHSAGFAAVLGLSRVGLPNRFARPVASWLGVPPKCESTSDCGDPCLLCPQHKAGEEVFCTPKCLAGCTKCEGGVCRDLCPDPCLQCNVRMFGEAPSCIPKCQAGCSQCENGECVDRGCKACEVCFQKSRPDGSCQSIESFGSECVKCDPETGKHTNRCSACERCVKGECVSNCPNRCEICDNGTCRKCDGPCEGCNDAGQCWRCDPECQRCNRQTGECETTCDGGFSCCSGKCINCCVGCAQGGCDEGGSAACADDAKNPACCGGRCHDLDSDVRNCGSCSTPCRDFDIQNGETCEHGHCVCKGVLEVSDGTLSRRGGGMECRQENHECCEGDCVDIASYQSDSKHCGKCIVECEKDERCEKGECVGSKRAGYSVVYSYTITSEKLGMESTLTMQATVRRLAAPDAEGNTLAGYGSYEGSIHEHKVNCDNKLPMDSETIGLGGKAKATATAESMGAGQTSLVFTITPINPPKRHLFTRSFRSVEQMGNLKDLPDAVMPAFGNVVLKGGVGQKSQTFQMFGGSCSGTLTHVMKWSAKRIQ